ncbi:MAG: hypothetical protein AAFX03_14530 [Pseudomonadota bacterium]
MRFSPLLIAALIAGPAAAQGVLNTGQAEDGWYVSGFVGAAFPSDAEFTGVQQPDPGIPSPAGNVAGVPAEIDIEFDTELYFGGAIGYKLPFTYLRYFQPRLEIEVSYLEKEVSGGSFNGGGQIFGGEQEILFVLLNNYSDIRWSDTQTVVPYIGGGIGVGIVDSDVQYFPPSAAGPVFAVQGDSTGFAGTIAGGLTWELSEQLDVYAEGRYYRVSGVDLERRFIGGGADIFNADVSDRLTGATATAGARFKF